MCGGQAQPANTVQWLLFIAMENFGPQFLHNRNPQFHTTPQVTHAVDYLRSAGERIPNMPAEKIAAYLGLLAHEQYVNDGILRANPDSAHMQIEAAVIHDDQIPENYFERERLRRREEGFGDTPISESMRTVLIDGIKNDQRYTLQRWAEHLGNADYEPWFKYLAWETITRLTREQTKEGRFRHRSRSTVLPHPDFSAEAVAYAYGIVQSCALEDYSQFDDPELADIAATGDFNRIYAYSLKKAGGIASNTYERTEGYWKVFNQSFSSRVATELAEMLQGYGTGWCTASPGTANKHLSGGAFWVYLSRNELGKDVVPRVAVRTESGKVAEVRGILPNQRIEPVMEPIVEDQLNKMRGARDWMQRANNMRLVTDLERRIQADPQTPLTEGEVRFLYEFDRPVEGFNILSADPRVKELKALRGLADVEALREMLPEKIHAQLPLSYRVYRHALEEVGQDMPLSQMKKLLVTPHEFKDAFDDRHETWKKNGVYDFMAIQFAVKGIIPSLIAVPNERITPRNLLDYYKSFNMTSRRAMPSSLTELSEAQWTAYDHTAGRVRFACMGWRAYAGVQKATADVHEVSLERLASQYNGMRIRPLSILDAVVAGFTSPEISTRMSVIWHFGGGGPNYVTKLHWNGTFSMMRPSPQYAARPLLLFY